MAEVLLVRDVMTRSVKTVRVDSTVREAVQKMNKFDIGSIVVMDDKKPVGIITERDIMRKIVEQCVDPSLVKAGDIMSHPLITTDPNKSVEEAARLMAGKKIKKLPVVEDGKLVGIVTSMDIMNAAPKLASLLQELIRSGRSAEPTG
ncbi:MAG: CBS domain-containing protein [Nitrososphaerota archaeon]|nr:CBS domain-containing protein [Nitrososphaerota archaeon]